MTRKKCNVNHIKMCKLISSLSRYSQPHLSVKSVTSQALAYIAASLRFTC